LVLAEHRRRSFRDITFEMLTKGKELSRKIGLDLTALLLGYNIKDLAKSLTKHATKVLVIDDARLENFNAETSQKILAHLILERTPLLTLIGQTACGIDLAPSLAAELNMPLATDCIDVFFKEDRLFVLRQMYGDRVRVKASLRLAKGYIVTLRPATFLVQEAEPLGGEIIEMSFPPLEYLSHTETLGYCEPAQGGIDIAAAEILVAVGRGIKDKEKLSIVEKLATALGGVLACSRPIVDKGWLPADRQVGISGKTVSPKLYLAVGISGAFQHLYGMKQSDLIISINKDSRAPIFRVAEYGVTKDLFKIIPALTNRIQKLKKNTRSS
jgi:electron transfer flavoprotein alpha subunit